MQSFRKCSARHIYVLQILVNLVLSVMYYINILSTLWAKSADDRLLIFLLFFHKTEIDISCKLSPVETICMKCRILFSEENKKTKWTCRLLKLLPRVQSVNTPSQHYNYLMLFDWKTERSVHRVAIDESSNTNPINCYIFVRLQENWNMGRMKGKVSA